MLKTGDKVLVSTATRAASPKHDPAMGHTWVETEALDVTYSGYGRNRVANQVYVDIGAGMYWVQPHMFKEKS